MTRVRAAQDGDRDRVLAFLDQRGMRYAARLGELHHAGADAALIAERGTPGSRPRHLT